MTNNRSAIKDIHFQNSRLTRIGVEVLSLAELRQRAPATLVAPQRVGFHLLLMVDTGRSKHRVDFVDVELAAGSVLFVRPGQVQQWLLDDSLQGHILLITAEALTPSVARAGSDMALIMLDEWPVHVVSEPSLFDTAKIDLLRLKQDISRFDGGELQAALIGHSLLSFLLRLAQPMRPASADAHRREAEIFRLFSKELEAHFSERLSVLDYANRLGYSQSTVSRACIAMAGHTAKDAIDKRIALEAKRLLIHSQTRVAYIGYQLGFADATNFVKFFRRMVGTTPLEYRAKLLGKI